MRKKKKKRLVVKSTAKDDDYTCFILETHTQFAHYEQYFFLCGVWLLLILFGSILPSSQPIDAQISHSHSTIPFKKKIRPRHKTVFCDIKYCIYRCLSLQLARILTATTSFPHMCKPKMCTTLLWFNSRIVSSAASHTTETHNMWSKRCLHANLRVLQPMYLSG